MYRYWDGHAWSAVTSSNPAAPPPSQGIGQPAPEQQQYGQGQQQYGQDQQAEYLSYQQQAQSKKSARGWWIGGLAVLVVVILVAVFAIRGLSGIAGTSGGNPLGPDPTSQDECPTTTQMPSANPDHPQDGRVHGGPLSYPMLGSPWEPPQSDDRVPFGSDVQVQQITIEPNYQPSQSWVASILVAELMAGDGFYTPEQGSEIVAKCVAGTFYGDNEVDREDQESKAMKVDGHDAWYLKSHLTFDIEGLEAKGETMIIVIVGAGASAGLYYASIPDNASQYMADAEKTLDALTVDT